jgi:hypothetical protein
LHPSVCLCIHMCVHMLCICDVLSPDGIANLIYESSQSSSILICLEKNKHLYK